MKTDPRTACANSNEARGWALLHDLIAHPFMALTNWSSLSLRFHDWTSNKAWPRLTPTGKQWVWERPSVFGTVEITAFGNHIYSIKHPRVQHAFVTQASSPDAAVAKAAAWFQILAAEFGGVFTQS